MKKVMTLFLILSSITPTALGQSVKSKDAALKDKIIGLEISGWSAWKDKNADWFQNNTTDECVWISADGITNQAQMIASTLTDCEVRSVSLDHFQFIKLNSKTVLLTYVAHQDGTCGQNELTPKIRASVNYVKRGGTWLEAFYVETPMPE